MPVGVHAHVDMLRRVADLPVVVVHYNAPDWVESSVASILASSGVTPRVLVVDNSGNAPDLGVEVVRPHQNLGYSGGANVGLRGWLHQTDADFCLAASHDLHVTPATLSRLVEVASGDPTIGLLGPAVNFPRPPIHCAGYQETGFVSGQCMLLRRSCVEQIGLFDEAFGSYTEDRDLSWRATASGWKVGVAGGAEARGLGSSSETADDLIFVNRMYLMGKHRGWHGLIRQGLMVSPWQIAVDVRGRRFGRASRRLASLPRGVRKGIAGVQTRRIS